ncbi:hypothetical protein BRD01_08650 [Halobacteriales archaeon QS_8_65_32]|nr:MAG: hypothetical protein BRD01_08650 [Halobacteriales archaeon QS_8_65_32]
MEIFALVDRDLENSDKYRTRNRIYQTPGYCIENLLPDSTAICEALQVIPGASKLSQHDLTAPVAIDERIREIISDPEFTQREIDQRLRDRLRSHIVADDLALYR